MTGPDNREPLYDDAILLLARFIEGLDEPTRKYLWSGLEGICRSCGGDCPCYCEAED